MQVTHYAGNVTYNVKDFTEKNSVINDYEIHLHVYTTIIIVYLIMQDELFHDFKRILYDCRLPIIKQMFPEVSNSYHSDTVDPTVYYTIT